MKILHLSSENGWRGGEQQLAYLLEETRRQQPHWQLLVAGRPGSAFEAYCRQQNFTFVPLGLKNNLDVASALTLKQYAQTQRADLIHVHSSRGQSVAWLAYLLGNRRPVVLTRRVAFAVKPKLLNKLKYNFAALKGIICVSEAARQRTLPALHRPRPLLVIHDGIQAQKFKPESRQTSLLTELGLDESTPLVGTVAALTPEKDVATFIRAAARIHQKLPRTHFIIMGEGPQLGELKQLASTLNLENRTHFLGFRTDVPQLLPQLSLFVLSSKEEGLGTSVLDAFASKVPVVATRAGGLPELVKPDKTGMLCPTEDADSIARAALGILSNKNLRTELVTNAYQVLHTNFTAERMAQRTLDFYRQVLA